MLKKTMFIILLGISENLASFTIDFGESSSQSTRYCNYSARIMFFSVLLFSMIMIKKNTFKGTQY